MSSVWEAERTIVLDGVAAERGELDTGLLTRGDAASAPQGRAASAIFLHSGWRSCGTWLWETLRDRDTVRAYYEPLHEDLNQLDRAALTRFSPGSWDSGHSPGAPYFAEYIPRLRRRAFGRRRGIDGYAPRFAFDDFFRDPAEDDPELRAYLSGLIAAAHAEGRLPVLKFCRSLGRVPWMARHFPDALHAVVLRDPVAQWLSTRRQMEFAKNRYFVLAPFVILARNASHPLLADALARLHVPMPPHLARDLGVTTQVCWHHVRGLTWAERYRGFLALWAASSVTALQSDAMIIDSESLLEHTPHGAAVEQALGRAAGFPLSLFDGHHPAAVPLWVGTEAEAQDAVRAAHAALDFVTVARATLPAAHTRLLVRKLAPRFRPAAALVTSRAALPPARAADAGAWLSAWIYVAVARLSYPLRRMHFYYRQWRPR
jgi:hypothetical protein